MFYLVFNSCSFASWKWEISSFCKENPSNYMHWVYNFHGCWQHFTIKQQIYRKAEVRIPSEIVIISILIVSFDSPFGCCCLNNLFVRAYWSNISGILQTSGINIHFLPYFWIEKKIFPDSMSHWKYDSFVCVACQDQQPSSLQP